MTNINTHSQTCRKGLHGRYMCRLSRPARIREDITQPVLVHLKSPSHLGKRKRVEFIIQPISGEAAVIDRRLDCGSKILLREHTNGTAVWEQCRLAIHVLFVEANISLACLSRSYTNSAIISGLDAENMVEEYQHSYMTKEKGGLKGSAAVMLTAVRDMEKYPSVAEDSGTYERKAKYLATRTVNAFTGVTEWPHQLMAYALAGNKSYISSDNFWYVFPLQLISYIEVDEENDAPSTT